MTSIIHADAFHELERRLHRYDANPAGRYVLKLVEEPRIEPSFDQAPFPPVMIPHKEQTLSTVYAELVGLARGAYRAFKRNLNLELYNLRKRWLGRVARECGDSLLLQAGLFPEALLTTRSRRGFWAANYEDALSQGPCFYDLATRLRSLEEEEGRDLYQNFGEWVERLHELKREFKLWARDIGTVLRLEEIGVKAYSNVTLLWRR